MVAACEVCASNWTTEAETGELIRALARQQPDAGIAAILNRSGKRTGKGNSWTESRVRSHRSAHGIAVYRDGEMAERGEIVVPVRIDDHRLGQLLVDLMMIDDDRVEAEPRGFGERLEARRAAVDGDEELCAALRKGADRLLPAHISDSTAGPALDSGALVVVSP